MAKANRLGYKAMPKDDGLRVGCKVSWHYYRDKTVADEASKVAVHNAEIDSGLGYDFGYQSPGSVRLIKGAVGEMAQFNDMWEVCTS